jgi:hypothetical protein
VSITVSWRPLCYSARIDGAVIPRFFWANFLARHIRSFGNVGKFNLRAGHMLRFAPTRLSCAADPDRFFLMLQPSQTLHAIGRPRTSAADARAVAALG